MNNKETTTDYGLKNLLDAIFNAYCGEIDDDCSSKEISSTKELNRDEIAEHGYSDLKRSKNVDDSKSFATLFDIIKEKVEAFNKEVEKEKDKAKFECVHMIADYIADLVVKSVENTNVDAKFFREKYDDRGNIIEIVMDWIFNSEDDKEIFDCLSTFLLDPKETLQSKEYLEGNLAEFLKTKFEKEFAGCDDFKVSVRIEPTKSEYLEHYVNTYTHGIFPISWFDLNANKIVSSDKFYDSNKDRDLYHVILQFELK